MMHPGAVSVSGYACELADVSRYACRNNGENTLASQATTEHIMGWNFRRRIGLVPGIRLNIGKRGVSVSFGIRGLRTTVGRGRTTSTVGIPGSGLSFTSARKANEFSTGDFAAFRRQHEQRAAKLETHPARVAFHERRRTSKLALALQRRPERLARNGGVEPTGHFVCAVCLYERNGREPGAWQECPDCGTPYSPPGARRHRSPFPPLLLVLGGLSVLLGLWLLLRSLFA